MSDKYKTFEDENIEYSYPLKWDKRNKIYLKMVEDRRLPHPEVFPLTVKCHDLSEEILNPELELEKYLQMIINCGDSNEE